MKHLGDITQIRGDAVPPVDVIIGGSPCQDLSVAGKRAGLAGERSGLYMEQIRIIKEMRSSVRANGYLWGGAPRYMVWENVPGAFSSNGGEDFRVVLEEAARIVEPECVIPRPPRGKWTNAGAIMGCGWSIAWRVHDAQFWGVPQRRRRIALVADFGGGSAPEILFERNGMRGDPAQSGAEGKETAADAENGVGAAIQCGNPWDSQSERVYVGDGAWHSLNSNSSGGQSRDGILTREKCPYTTEEGYCGKDKKLFKAYCIQGNCIDRADTAGCNGKGWRDDDMSYTLNTIDRPAVCVSGDDVADTLDASYYKGCGERGFKERTVVADRAAVRRLTPLECERLQGYPDGWTDIGEWVDSKGKRRQTTDSARYKALGNSIALPYWRYLLKRISAQFEYTPTMASLFDGIGGFPYLWESINGKGTCRWASEIEEFPMAVTKLRIGD